MGGKEEVGKWLFWPPPKKKIGCGTTNDMVFCAQNCCMQIKKCKMWFQKVVCVHELTPQIQWYSSRNKRHCLCLLAGSWFASQLLMLWSIILAMVCPSFVVVLVWFFPLWLRVMALFNPEIAAYSVAGLYLYSDLRLIKTKEEKWENMDHLGVLLWYNVTRKGGLLLILAIS